MGSDTPEISSEIIIKAARSLAENKCVIGSANDGGAFLIGVSESAFQESGFSDLKSKSDYQYQNLLGILNGVLLKEQLSDIDTIHDWNEYIELSKESSFLWHLLVLFRKGLNIDYYLDFIYRTYFHAFLPLRGPPNIA